MKKFIYFITSIFLLISLLFYLATRYPSIDVLPDNYSLHKQKSFLFFTYRVRIYKINKKVDLIKIQDYPKSKELKKYGYDALKWHRINVKERVRVIKYLEFLSNNCKCHKTEASKIIAELQTDFLLNKDSFLFSTFDTSYYIEKGEEIGLVYFYLLNKSTNALYAFEVRPNM